MITLNATVHVELLMALRYVLLGSSSNTANNAAMMTKLFARNDSHCKGGLMPIWYSPIQDGVTIAALDVSAEPLRPARISLRFSAVRGGAARAVVVIVGRSPA